MRYVAISILALVGLILVGCGKPLVDAPEGVTVVEKIDAVIVTIGAPWRTERFAARSDEEGVELRIYRPDLRPRQISHGEDWSERLRFNGQRPVTIRFTDGEGQVIREEILSPAATETED